MKLFTRFFTGLFSSLLLSAGLSHAASRLDPLTQQLGSNPEINRVVSAPSSGCNFPCAYAQPRAATQVQR